MPIPYELAGAFDSLSRADPNDILIGRSFYYSDASPQIGRGPTTSALVEFDSNAVIGQIEMVIGTPIGSEEMEPTFGSDATKRLFDGMTQDNLNGLELEILDALKRWLKARLDFLSVTCNKDPNSGDVIVLIPFRVRLSGQTYRYLGNLSNMARQSAF